MSRSKWPSSRRCGDNAEPQALKERDAETLATWSDEADFSLVARTAVSIAARESELRSYTGG